METFTLFWRTGDREVIAGNNIADAITNRGYGNGALSVLDFWARGENDDYEWIADEREWRKKPGSARFPSDAWNG